MWSHKRRQRNVPLTISWQNWRTHWWRQCTTWPSMISTRLKINLCRRRCISSSVRCLKADFTTFIQRQHHTSISSLSSLTTLSHTTMNGKAFLRSLRTIKTCKTASSSARKCAHFILIQKSTTQLLEIRSYWPARSTEVWSRMTFGGSSSTSSLALVV